MYTIFYILQNFYQIIINFIIIINDNSIKLLNDYGGYEDD